MAQVTIYLDKETATKMRAFAEATGISQSQWVASLIQEKLRTEWPESIVALAGAWEDFPLAEELRAGAGEDLAREPI